MTDLPDLSSLSHAEKDALIRALWERLQAAERRIADYTRIRAATDNSWDTGRNLIASPSRWWRSWQRDAATG